MHSQVMPAVESLPAELREVVNLIYFHNLKDREVAQRLGISRIQLHIRKEQAISKIRDFLSTRRPVSR